jgi:putative acetyltransferase
MAATKLSIRNAQAADLVAMQQLFVDTISTVCAADYDVQQLQAWTAGVRNKERWDSIMTHQFVVVAQIADQIVGFASLDKNSVDLMYVHKDHQRKGIAQELLAAIEYEARRTKQTLLVAEVSKSPFF